MKTKTRERGAVTIYALLADLKEGSAAYIGQTVSFRRRMHEHCIREGKAATQLIRQAETEGREVRVIILETAYGVDEADTAEGAWVWQAKAQGLRLIALESWQQRKHSTQKEAASKVWPDAATIAQKAQPLHSFTDTTGSLF